MILPIHSVRRFLLGSLLGMLTLGMIALVCENISHTITLNQQLTEIHIEDAAKIIHVLIENNHDHLPTQLHLDDALHQATQALVTQFAQNQVTMYATKQRKTISLHIVDNGPGIPTNKQKRIFDRFYREPGSNETGSGLGLSIVKEIVILHGGTIRAVTPKSGVGREMVVTFPIG